MLSQKVISGLHHFDNYVESKNNSYSYRQIHFENNNNVYMFYQYIFEHIKEILFPRHKI